METDTEKAPKNYTTLSMRANNYVKFKLTRWRWVQLGFIAIFFLTNYISYANYMSLGIDLTHFMGAKKFNVLTSVYSLPNIVLPFVAGILIDIIGMRAGIIGYSALMVIGMFVEYLSTLNGSYGTIVAGTAIFGIGSEAMCIIGTAFAATWFMGKELSLGLSVVGASANLGSVAGNWILPPLFHSDGEDTTASNFEIPFLFCFIAMCVGFGASICQVILDKYAQKSDEAAEKKIKSIADRGINDSIKQNAEDALLEGGEADVNAFQDENEDDEKDKKQDEEEKMKLSDLKKLNDPRFWAINLFYMFMTAASAVFGNNLETILGDQYGLDSQIGGRFVSLTTIQVALFTPLIALATDKIGYRTLIIPVSSICVSISFVIWAFIPACPDGGCYWFLIPMIINGFGGSLLAAVAYAVIPLVVDKSVLGSAFGLQDCIQQLGMALAPFAAGPLVQKAIDSQKFNTVYWFFCILAIVATIFAVLIFFYDRSHGNKLNKKQGEYDGMTKMEAKASMKKSFGVTRKSMKKSFGAAYH